MVPLLSLWLPIIVATVIVFFVSSLLHMLLPWHKSDYTPIPDEDSVRTAIRNANLKPGVYMFPFCAHDKMKDPAMQKKFEEGPVGHLTMLPNGKVNMGKYLGLWILYCLMISTMCAFIAGHVTAPGANYMHVFKLVSAIAFMSYCLAVFEDSIWKGAPWSNTIKGMIDGLIYALMTAGSFGWLWPKQ